LAETFLARFTTACVGEEVFIDQLASQLAVERRRIYNVVHILESLCIVQKKGKERLPMDGHGSSSENIRHSSTRRHFLARRRCTRQWHYPRKNIDRSDPRRQGKSRHERNEIAVPIESTLSALILGGPPDAQSTPKPRIARFTRRYRVMTT
jgi:hypothetical protein